MARYSRSFGSTGPSQAQLFQSRARRPPPQLVSVEQVEATLAGSPEHVRTAEVAAVDHDPEQAHRDQVGPPLAAERAHSHPRPQSSPGGNRRPVRGPDDWRTDAVDQARPRQPPASRPSAASVRPPPSGPGHRAGTAPPRCSGRPAGGRRSDASAATRSWPHQGPPHPAPGRRPRARCRAKPAARGARTPPGRSPRNQAARPAAPARIAPGGYVRTVSSVVLLSTVVR